MDVLIRPRRWARWSGWLALSAWLLATACLSLPASRRSEPSFPHRVHVVDNQLACTFCHGSVRSSDAPGMPPPELCAPCHDRFDQHKPPERRVGAFFGPDSRYRTVAVSGRSADVRFSHRAHVTAAGLDCTTCHGDVAQQDDVPLQPLTRKSDCMDCHQRHGEGNACSVCHTSVDRDWLPDSHRSSWVRFHGEHVRAGSERSEDRCTLCHQDATGCNACHQQQAPQDHDQSFRLRTHGMQASIDRSRCAVCHTQDSCQQCHEVTRPQSHRAGFGNNQQRHCVGCHLPLADSGCSVCHRDSPGHATASPLPPDHVPSMNCRACHGNGVRLPHPDGGHVCTACHR